MLFDILECVEEHPKGSWRAIINQILFGECRRPKWLDVR